MNWTVSQAGFSLRKYILKLKINYFFFLKLCHQVDIVRVWNFAVDEKTTKTCVISFSGEMVLGVSESVASADS
jgi:hypothetical protein